MAYTRHYFSDGTVLNAAALNDMEQGIMDSSEAASTALETVTDVVANALKIRGVLESGSNFDDVKTSGIWVVPYDKSYTGNPISGSTAALTVIASGIYVLQIMDAVNGAHAMRHSQTSGSSWGEWRINW